MSKLFIGKCTGSYEVNAPLKILAFQEALRLVYKYHRRLSVDNIYLYVFASDGDDYTVNYSFQFSAYGESEIDIQKLIKKGETLEILSAE